MGETMKRKGKRSAVEESMEMKRENMKRVGGEQVSGNGGAVGDEERGGIGGG